MKTRFTLAGISLLAFTHALHAQTAPGFPPLPPVPETGQLQDQPGATKFRFIVAGDNRPASDTPTPPPVLTKIFEDAQRLYKPAFFLWAGDIIYGHDDSDPKKLEAQYKGFFNVAALGKAPVFNSPGNHEMDTITHPSNEKVEIPTKELQDYYLKFMKFPAGAPPYGAFNYGNSRFIAVDTEEPGGPSPSPACTPTPPPGKTLKLDPGFVSVVQLKLLKGDLEVNKDKAHIFIFMHHPIKPAKCSSGLNSDNATALEALFKNYPNVSYVIAAHEHLYYNASGSTLEPADREDPSAKGPIYLISGGAGAQLDDCPASAGGNCMSHHHYLVFDVEGSAVKVQVIRVHPPDKEKESARGGT